MAAVNFITFKKKKNNFLLTQKEKAIFFSCSPSIVIVYKKWKEYDLNEA